MALSSTGVVSVYLRPKIVASISVVLLVKSLRDPSMRTRGARAAAAKERVSPTEVDVVFWAIQDIATEMFLEVVGG